MFHHCFVPANVAVVLSEAGFDELCMAYWEHTPYTSELHIGYISQHIELKNSDLPKWFYSAPIYDQVFEWLFRNGINIHDVYIPAALSGNNAGLWRVSLFDIETGGQLWPSVLLRSNGVGVYRFDSVPNYLVRKEAWNDAILNALKRINHKTL